MVNYESIYPGATYLFDPGYNFGGFKIPAGDMGGTTSIQTANQLKEVSKLLNNGMKVTEVSIIQPEVFEMMPKDHLKEIYRLNKLTGAESTMHAPLIEPSGVMDANQGGWSEESRVMAEEQLKGIVIRSHELNPNGNIPVTIHASNLPGTEMIPEVEKGEGPVIGRMIAIDQKTGRPMPMERDETFYPESTKFAPGERAKGEIFTPEKRLRAANSTTWTNSITDLDFYKKEADQIIINAQSQLFPYFEKIEKGEEPSPEEMKNYAPALEQMKRADRFMDKSELDFKGLFETAARFSDLDKVLGQDEKGNKVTVRKHLNNISKEWRKFTEDRGELYDAYQSAKGREPNLSKLPIKSQEELLLKKSKLIDDSLKQLGQLREAPKQFIQIEEFAKDKSSETLANVAMHGFKKFGNTAPIISVENPPYGMAIASGKDLKELVEKTRGKFIEKAMTDPKMKMTKWQAEKTADKLIGVTWDTSHISMMRKQGFKGKDVVEETKQVAPMVKHLHYNDNFGTTHTDLPAGMGDLPMKDILTELDKKGFKGKRIFEGGNFFQHFQTSPFIYTLESGGSPLYASGGEPFWNQMGQFGNYYSGHGAVNPTIHHQTYGAGFNNLPMELGGEIAGGGANRLSGTPMQ